MDNVEQGNDRGLCRLASLIERKHPRYCGKDASECNGKTQVALLFLVSPISKKGAFKNTGKRKDWEQWGEKFIKSLVYYYDYCQSNEDDNYFYANYCCNSRALHNALCSPV